MGRTAAGDKAAADKALGDTAADRVLVGLVRRPHGLRGEVKVEVQSDNPERFAPGAVMFLALPGRPQASQRLEIASVREDRDTLLVHFVGHDDRNAVEGWQGGRLEVEASMIPALPPGEIYSFELLGRPVVDERAGEIGVVADVVDDGGGTLLLVKHQGAVLPIPYVAAFGCHLEEGRLRVVLPDGFVETFLQADGPA